MTGDIDSVAWRTRGPESRIKKVSFRVLDATTIETETAALKVEDPWGETFQLMFTPDSPGRSDQWTIGDWYTFHNLIYFPNSIEKTPTCPSCANSLTIMSGPVADAVELLRGLKTAQVLVGSQDFDRDHVTEDEWLTSATEDVLDPIEWTCGNCEATFTEQVTGDDTQQYKTEHESETLFNRLSQSLTSTSGSQRSTARQSQKTACPQVRQRLLAGEIPEEDEIDYQAIIEEYGSNTAHSGSTNGAAFSPEIDRAVVEDPITADIEHYCNLRFQPKAFDWERSRPDLNLVVAIDISGSMWTSFDDIDEPDNEQTHKLAHVAEFLAGLIQRLSTTDTFGIVLFRSNTFVAKPRLPVTEETYMSLADNLQDVNPGGSSNMLAGYTRAASLFHQGQFSTDPGTENRILVISDSPPPNVDAGDDSLTGQIEDEQRRGVHTSFIGLDCAERHTTQSLCKIPGANEAFPQSKTELEELFRRRIDSLLFPIAFDLTVRTDRKDEVLNIATESDPQRMGCTLHRKTVFPPGPTRQSLVETMIQLPVDDDTTTFEISWKARDGTEHSTKLPVSFGDMAVDTFDSDAIRTKVAIQHYIRALKTWARVNHQGRTNQQTESSTWTGYQVDGDAPRDSAQSILRQIREYIVTEMIATNTDRFEREVDVLDSLIDEVG